MIRLKYQKWPKFGRIFGLTRKFGSAEAEFQIQLFGFGLAEAESQCQNSASASFPLNLHSFALY